MKELPLEEVIYYQIDRTTRAMRRYSIDKIKNAGYSLTIDQWLVLKSIEEKQHLTQNQLAQDIYKDGASVSRIIDDLVKKGMMNRRQNSQDRRVSILELTEKGIVELKKVKKIMREIRSNGVKNLNAKDVQTAMNVLKSIQNEFTIL